MRVCSAMAILLLVAGSSAAASNGLKIWGADALTKIEQSQKPADKAPDVYLEAVRNEYENGQFIVTAGTSDRTLSLRTSAFRGPSGARPRLSAQFAGYVPIRKGTPQIPDSHLVAKPPADLPDPVLADDTAVVRAGKNQAVWVTVYVPRDCEPGVYRSNVSVIADTQEQVVPVTVRVRDFVLPDDRTLQITNWFSPQNIAKAHGLTMWSESYWKMLGRYAELMSDYRQNVTRTLLFDLITATEDAEGSLSFDFSRFDKWVRLLQDKGIIGTIEGSHLAYRTDWRTNKLVGHRPATTLPDGSAKVWQQAEVTSAEQTQFLSQFLPALQKHLVEMGWADRYIQHLADEPNAASAPAYNALASAVRKYMPGVKLIDATMCREVAGSVDIWVPQPSEIDSHPDFFAGRRKQGEALWIYTCLGPKGKYMNRFIDQHLLSPRLLHWLNFKDGFPGYLHWGLNFWANDPYTNVERTWDGKSYLPSGDSHIVYPVKYGPIRSIRLDAMRDGIEDYELLRLLEKKDPARAGEIACNVVRSMTDYTLDPAEFRQARQKLLDALEARR